MSFLRKLIGSKQCEIPFCDRTAFRRVRAGNDIHYFCQKHFNDCDTTVEAKKRADNNWWTEERKRRMLYPTNDERTVVENLVQKGLFEPCIWDGRPSYRPTEKFNNSIAKMELDLLLRYGYHASMFTSMMEGCRIALSITYPDLKMKEAENRAEIISPYVLFSRRDEEIHGGHRTQESAQTAFDPAREKRIEDAVAMWLQEDDYQVEKYNNQIPRFWNYIFSRPGGKSPTLAVSRAMTEIDQIVVTTTAPWPSYDSQNQKEAEIYRNLGLDEDKIASALSVLKKKLNEIDCHCEWLPGKRSMLLLGKTIDDEELSQNHFRKVIKTVTDGAIIHQEIWTELLGEVSDENKKHLKPEFLKEIASNESKDVRVEENIQKWFVAHNFAPHVQKISLPNNNFTFTITYGSRPVQVFVYKPKDKVDQIVVSLSHLWDFGSERRTLEFLNLKNEKGESALANVKKVAEKMDYDFRSERSGDGKNLTLFFERNIPYDRLTETFFFQSLKGLLVYFQAAMKIIDKAMLLSAKSITEKTRQLVKKRLAEARSNPKNDKSTGNE